MLQTLQQIGTSLTAILFALQATLAGMPASTQLAQVAQTATVSLSPSSYSVSVNGTFTVNILLNAGGQNAYGADINRLRFNPAILQVADADAGTAGVQIAAGSLMPLTIINSVDNTGGSVQFSQLATPGSTFSGSGTLATITFRAVAVGSSYATFNFTLGNGTDTNVAGLGGDLLASVGSGTYNVTPAPDTTAPSAPGTPVLTVVSSSQINLSWAASTDAVGVTGYRVERCSGSATCTAYSQIATPTTNSYSNTGLSASTIYRYRIRAVDAAGNLSAYSSSANATTQVPLDTTPPVISSISASGIITTGASISWTTNENSDTQVEYGTTVSYGNSTTLNTSLVTAHSASLANLLPLILYHYKVKSRDAALNLAQSGDQTFTTIQIPKKPKNFKIQSIEGRQTISSYPSATVYTLNAANTSILNTQTISGNAAGGYTVNFSVSIPTAVNLRIHIAGYLSRLITDVNTTADSATTILPQLMAGDFNDDDIINSLDFSFMNDRWGAADALSDINKDGVVNSLDFAYLSNNWLLAGE